MSKMELADLLHKVGEILQLVECETRPGDTGRISRPLRDAVMGLQGYVELAECEILQSVESGAAVEPSSADPWAHRSAKMRCQTCMWSSRKGDRGLGRCRRRAPTMSGYPVIVLDEDWCGEHKLDEDRP